MRKALLADYSYVIEELLYIRRKEVDKGDYFENIITTIIDIGQDPDFIAAVCDLIKWAGTSRTWWGTSSPGATGRTS